MYDAFLLKIAVHFSQMINIHNPISEQTRYVCAHVHSENSEVDIWMYNYNFIHGHACSTSKQVFSMCKYVLIYN